MLQSLKLETISFPKSNQSRATAVLSVIAFPQRLINTIDESDLKRLEAETETLLNILMCVQVSEV